MLTLILFLGTWAWSTQLNSQNDRMCLFLISLLRSIIFMVVDFMFLILCVGLLSKLI